MARTHAKKKRSEQLSEFLNFIRQSKQEYTFAKTEMEKADKLTQDLLHKLELGCTTAAERSKVAKELQTCRKDRRYYKDIIEELGPIIEFIEEGGHKKTLDMLPQVLGKVRKVEEYHENRTYKPKCSDAK